MPPPPLEKPEDDSTFFVDPQLSDPPGAGPIQLERAPSEQQLFSVDNAIQTDEATPVNTYWFVDFNVDAPQKWLTEDRNSLNLCGCDPDHFGVAGDRTVTLEVLITPGELVFDFTLPDPRRTAGGEPIYSLRWTIMVTGGQDPDCVGFTCPD